MFKIEFKTGNAAFEGEYGKSEIIRILKGICEKIENGYTKGIVMDYNGNRVGDWEITD